MKKEKLQNCMKLGLSLIFVLSAAASSAQNEERTDTGSVDEVVVTALGIKKEKKKRRNLDLPFPKFRVQVW